MGVPVTEREGLLCDVCDTVKPAEQVRSYDGRSLMCDDCVKKHGHPGGEDPELITARRAVYGNPEETFPRVAEVWSGICGHTINAVDVPLMMAGYKLVRTQVCPDYSDNSDDIDGYMDIFKLLVGEDMVQARSVEEYLRIKSGIHVPDETGRINAWPESDTRPCVSSGMHINRQRHPLTECPTYS